MQEHSFADPNVMSQVDDSWEPLRQMFNGPASPEEEPPGDAEVSFSVSELDRIRARLDHAEQRADNAEAELERVRVAVADAAGQVKAARRQRQQLLMEAQELAKEIVLQARKEAQQGPTEASGAMTTWASVDPTLDARVDSFLEQDMEPDATRGWMLNDA